MVPMLGFSMPAVTMRFEMTKQDMRKGRKTGWPVSVSYSKGVYHQLGLGDGDAGG